MKRLQRASINILPEHKRPGARESMKRQNRLARRIGLPLMVFAMNLVIASTLVTAVYFIILGLGESGALSVPNSPNGN